MAELMRERKGRGGKTVTVIAGLQLSDDDLKALAKQLKQQCGSGGAVKEATLRFRVIIAKKLLPNYRRWV